MTDRPIPFSAPMVQALLAGRKTQTRRILKPQPDPWKNHYGEGGGSQSDWNWSTCWQNIDDRSRQFVLRGNCGFVEDHFQKLPYAPGDRLWVREAWRMPAMEDIYSGAETARNCLEAGYIKPWAAIRYEADGSKVNWSDDFGQLGRYRHARYMPRWASRLTLIVTDVRVQRLQDISEDDAKAEGVRTDSIGTGTFVGREDLHEGRQMMTPWPTAREAFVDLWNSIHGPGSWDANPWVVALTFDVIQKNIDEMETAG